MGSIRSFEDLDVWKQARSVRRKFYSLSADWPQDERYNLTAQIRSAAVSLTANLAEGFGRFHFKENIQFCRVARGSSCELMDLLITCRDQEYISDKTYDELKEELSRFLQLINGYMRSIRKTSTDPGKEPL